MSLNDLYRVTHVQSYGIGGQQILNVYYYKQITAATNEGAEHLAAQWIGALSSAIESIQNAAIRWVELRVENLTPGPDFFTQPFTPATDGGTRTGQCLPPFVTWSFRLNRSSSAVRNGQKRFAGVGEDDQANGIADGAMTTLFNVLATQLAVNIGGPPPASAVYQPRIFRAGRPSVTIPEKVIPAMLQADFDVGSATYVAIQTQNSRKFNVGV